MTATAVSLRTKLAAVTEHWSPKIVARYNGNEVLVVKVLGEFVWHSHPDTDDLFLVLQGALTIQMRDEAGPGAGLREVRLGPGELYVVPRGVEHRPVAQEETHLMLIEPAGTPNTGDKATAVVKVEI